jgi:hypothetical protein
MYCYETSRRRPRPKQGCNASEDEEEKEEKGWDIPHNKLLPYQ